MRRRKVYRLRTILRELYWKFDGANEIAGHIARVDFVSKIMAFIPHIRIGKNVQEVP